MVAKAERNFAINAGEKFYFTGRPCKHGHICKRDSISGKCNECRRLYQIINHKKWYQKNRSKKLEQNLEWRKSNKERLASICAAWYLENKPRHKIKKAAWNAKNKEKILEYAKAWHAARYRNPEYRTTYIARSILQHSLKLIKYGKRQRTFDALGFSKEDLKAHLEKYFKEGMSWANHGEWHADHVIPISEFIRLGIYDIKSINALSNLRPLWAIENLQKKDHFALSVQ